MLGIVIVKVSCPEAGPVIETVNEYILVPEILLTEVGELDPKVALELPDSEIWKSDVVSVPEPVPLIRFVYTASLNV